MEIVSVVCSSGVGSEEGAAVTGVTCDLDEAGVSSLVTLVMVGNGDCVDRVAAGIGVRYDSVADGAPLSLVLLVAEIGRDVDQAASEEPDSCEVSAVPLVTLASGVSKCGLDELAVATPEPIEGSVLPPMTLAIEELRGVKGGVARTEPGFSEYLVFPAVEFSIAESGRDDDEVVFAGSEPGEITVLVPMAVAAIGNGGSIDEVKFAGPQPGEDSAIFLAVPIENPGSSADGSVFAEPDSAEETKSFVEKTGGCVGWVLFAKAGSWEDSAVTIILVAAVRGAAGVLFVAKVSLLHLTLREATLSAVG